MKRVLSLILSVLMVVSVVSFGSFSVAAETTTLIEKGSDWSYWWTDDAAAELPAGWSAADFDASDWDCGQAPFGNVYFGDRVTELNAAKSLFILDFEVVDASALTTITMQIRYDENPVIYVNGTEVWSANNYHDGSYKTVDLSDKASAFVDGTNRIAIYLENVFGGYCFDMSLEGGTPDAVDANGNVAFKNATATHEYGGIGDARNIFDGDQNSIWGTWFVEDMACTINFYDFINVTEITLSCKNEGEVGGQPLGDQTAGLYDLYVGGELVASSVPAKAAGYTVTLNEPALGKNIRVVITEWYSTGWGGVAELSAKGEVANEVETYVLTDEAYFVDGLGKEYDKMNDYACNTGYADIGSWSDDIKNPAFGTDGACFMEIDLCTLCNIETIWAANYIVASRIYKWDAYVTDDNTKPISQWTKVGGKITEEGSTTDGYTLTLDEAVEGRYIRLYGMYNSDNTGFHFTEITVTGNYVDPSKPLAQKVADFGISPYGGAYKGFENWAGNNGMQTQLLICYSGLPETYATNTWRLHITSDTETKVVEAKPATSYDNWLHRFELAIEEGENQFIPENGAKYSIFAEVLDENGNVLHTSRTYHAFKCLSDPITPVTFEGYQLGTDGSSIRFIGSVNDTTFENVDLKITVENYPVEKNFSNPTSGVFKTLNSVDGVAATVTDSGVEAPVVIDAEYLFGYAVTGIPAGTYTFKIVPTATTASGLIVTGETATITVTIG